MIYNEHLFLQAISLSFQKYKEHGARSTEKLKPLHLAVADLLKEIWHESNFELHYLGTGSKEKTVEGKYHPKDIDICVTDEGKPIFCLGIKFITSNYKQNANNYFENMMGETANIQAMKDLHYAQLIIMRQKMPYYGINKLEIPEKIEVIDEKDLNKYLKLSFDAPQAHIPHFLGIFLVDINEQNYLTTSCNLPQEFGKEFADLLDSKLSLATFFKEIGNYKRYFIYTKLQENIQEAED